MGATFVAVVLFVVWLLAVLALAIAGLEALTPSSYPQRPPRWGRGIGFAVASIVLSAGGVALAIGERPKDPHAHQLCLAGHEVWARTRTYTLVGKIMVPITTTRKAWICERWEE